MNAILAAMVLTGDAGIGENGIVRVMVDDLSGSGSVMVLLFDGEAGIPPDPEQVLASGCVETDEADSGIVVSFLGVPYGEYAVLAFLDLDGDREPDLGSGSGEPCGWSSAEPSDADPGPRGAGNRSGSPPGSPPSGGGRDAGEIVFEAISFDHSADETRIRVRMAEGGGTVPPEGSSPGGMPPGGPPPV